MTTQTLRERVLAATIGGSAAQTILANAEKVPAPDQSPAKDARNALYGIIRKHLAEGTPIPLEAADDMLAAEQNQQRIELISELHRLVLSDARTELEQLLEYPADDVFTLLNTELDDTMRQVRDLLPALNGATTATQALGAGGKTVDAWRALIDLAARYDEIRTLQRQHTRGGITPDVFVNAGLYRDSLNVSAKFRERAALPPIAPVASDSGWWPDDVERETALIRIAQTTDPWTPTPNILTQVNSIAHQLSAARRDAHRIDAPRGLAAEFAARLEAEYERLTRR